MDIYYKAIEGKESLPCTFANWKALWIYKDHERLFNGGRVSQGIYKIFTTFG